MSLLQWKKFWRRGAVPQRARIRPRRFGVEPLESRQMLTLLGIGTVSVPSSAPFITYDSTGHIAYTASSDDFHLTASPLAFQAPSSPPHGITDPRSVDVHVQVDNSGHLIGGVPGDDLTIIGTDTADSVSGVLLTGEVLQFGYLESGATDQYDFRFAVTGGALASYWAGHDIGMTVSSENSSFNNDFSLDFAGGAKGQFSSIAPLPAHIIVDKVTNPSGDPTSFAFSTTGSGYSGFSLTDTDPPNDQTLAPGSYSVAEMVPAGWDLTNLSVVDPTSDSSTSGSTATLNLAPGETIHVTYTDTERGHIIVDKVTNPSGDPTSFAFSTTGSGYSGFSLTDTDPPNDQTLAPGSYSVAEMVPAGWDLTNLSVVDPTSDSSTSGSTATLNLAPGETIHVTYTDTERGHIIVDKVTNPSGDPTSFAFNTTGSGYSGFSLTDQDTPNDQTLAPGSYSVAEMVPAGWDLSNLSVVDPTSDSSTSGSTATLNLAPGETIHVTYTDTERGHIIVDKVTNPSGDPTSFAFNTTGSGYSGFSLTDQDTPNDQTLAPGSYSVAEMVPAGWDLSNLSVVDPTSDSSTSGSTATLNLAPGETIHVTYTDTERGHIIVDKVTNPSGDPTSFSFNTTGSGYSGFSLTDQAAPNDQTLAPGSYSVAEMVPAGWDLSNLSVVDPTSDSSTSGSTATLNLAPGETIHVTYTDTERGHIIVDKVTNPSGDPTSFSFNTTGSGYSGFSLTDQDTPNDQTLAPGSYSVAEMVPAGWDLSNLSVVDPTGDSSTSGSTATLNLAPGETIHVTFTDTERGHIIVDKVTNPSGDPTSFSFNTTGSGYTGFSLTDQDTPNDQTLAPGSYSVAEMVPAGWDLSNLSVVDPTGDSSTSGSTATLNLAPGETIHVTYTDTKRGHIIVDKVTNPSGDPTSFSFNTTGTGYSGFSLTDTAPPNDQVLKPGTYSVSETVPSGWSLQSIAIADPSGGSSYTGTTSTLSLAAGETIYVTYTDKKMVGSICGTKYLDVTGNGLTADDTPMANVQIYLDTNNDGVHQATEPVTTTATNGTYAFNSLPAGTYNVREIVPTGFVRTNPALSDHYTIALAAGQTSTGNNFANAETCDLSILTNIVYVINGTTPVTDMRGNTHEGDTIEVSFTVTAGHAPHQFTLVAYTAPGPTFVASQASQQQIFDIDTGVFSAGTYTLTVSIPHSYYQVDFVCGPAIDHFGPDGSNIFYSQQNRLFSADNGGTHAVLNPRGSLTGTVYLDTNNNGAIDSGERGIAGTTVTATNGTLTQTVVTDTRGVYTFDNLPTGTYTITETTPLAYTDGKDTLGNKGGTASNDKFTGIVLTSGANGTGYNFGEQQVNGAAFAANQTGSSSYWNGTSGQALIKALNGGSNATNLGNWLATNFNAMFGASAGSTNNLTGKTNAQVAAYFQALYANTAKKPETEALALALSVYVTNSSLAGTTASSYGFAVSSTGLGASTANVGVNGAAFGVSNGSVMTVMELLIRTNARARNGILWDTNGDGVLSTAETALRNQGYALFSSINNT